MAEIQIQFTDDDPALLELVRELLTSSGYAVRCHSRAEEALLELREFDFDVVIADVNLNQESGLDFCRRVKENWPHTPVILVSGFGTMNTAIDAIRVGATDFLNKPLHQSDLVTAVQSALQRGTRERIERLRAAPVSMGPREDSGPFLGESPEMRDVYQLIRRVAPTDTTVLFGGESGTGKELAAHALHTASRRAALPFVAINCAAVSPHLMESELFGHVKGSFTDAKGARQGLFETAGDGTVLLDEIGEMPLELQPKLLRALQERQVRPVGANTHLPMRARIVAATNRNLEEEVKAGRFREDLYYRLNVVQIDLPPLRARDADILNLARHFLAKFSQEANSPVQSIGEEAALVLKHYAWPGNVRELENAMRRAVALATGEQIQVADLSERIRSGRQGMSLLENVTLFSMPLDEVEHRHIERMLMHNKGNKTKTAKALGVDRRTLYRKLDALEVWKAQRSRPLQLGAASH